MRRNGFEPRTGYSHRVTEETPEYQGKREESGSARNRLTPRSTPRFGAIVCVAVACFAAFSSLAHSAGESRPLSLTPIGEGGRTHGWQRGLASSYGPGLYGNRTACGQTLTPATRGVAHQTLRCGTRLRICQGGRCTHARVIDRGPYSGGRVLDLTAATTRELCGCTPYGWGVRSVRYKKAPL